MDTLPRYERAVGFHTGDAATVGWMSKIGGWSITEAGVEALDTYESADELWTELRGRLREVDRKRKQAQSNLSEVQQFVAETLALVEPGTWTAHDDLAELAGTTAGRRRALPCQHQAGECLPGPQRRRQHPGRGHAALQSTADGSAQAPSRRRHRV